MFLTDRPLAQGELTFWAVSPDFFSGMETEPTPETGGAFVLAHSEKGHHHVLDREAAEVRTIKSAGIEMLHAIVREPTKVRNLGASGHGDLDLAPGDYLVIKQREVGMDDMIWSSAD